MVLCALARPMGVHSTICKCGGGVVQRHNDYVRALAALIYQITSCRVSVEKRTRSLEREFQGATQEGQMDIITTDFRGMQTYIDVAIVSPIVQDHARIAAAASRNGYAAKRMEAIKHSRCPKCELGPVCH